MADYPEPFERVVGMNRIGDPLIQFGRDAEAARSVIVSLARLLVTAAHGDGAARFAAAVARRMREPKPGDYVIVRGSKGWADGKIAWREAFGVLLAARTEQSSISGPDVPGEPVQVAYVQYGPRVEDVTRWVGVTVLKVPVGVSLAEMEAGMV